MSRGDETYNIPKQKLPRTQRSLDIAALQTFQHNLPLPGFYGLSAFSTFSPAGGGPKPN
jgi:hypothetical protein